ncbi:beta-carotene hydroxylase [Candidatus Bathyarchaeota archaeon]|nr:beta-carotene hydroxylase [Candidatus Bathyarchaeota archaeon]NIV43510.1 beta-carotene hydroxylase [Candidatus Bathyarchaeota archaeon]
MIINVLIYTVTTLVTFVFMEGVAWFLHKYVMHGIGWYLHEDHHRPRKGRFEKNDAFGLFFAVVSFLFILTGILSGFHVNLAIGFGIMLYGVGYFMVHDVFFHKRVKIQYRPKSRYIKRILNAHAAHHRVSTSDSGVCFGFLYASKEYSV